MKDPEDFLFELALANEDVLVKSTVLIALCRLLMEAGSLGFRPHQDEVEDLQEAVEVVDKAIMAWQEEVTK